MACVSGQYHALVRLVPDPVFVVGTDRYRLLGTNDRATELLGYDRQDLTGTEFPALGPDESAEACRELFDRLDGDTEELRTDRLPDGSQLCLVAEDGSRVPIELHAHAVVLDGDRRIYATARDTTQRYERGQQLERQNERFTEFASIAGHDLRNPLSVAQGRLKMAQEEVTNHHLDEVERAHERMETLISDLLTLAREGDSAVEPEPVDLPGLVTSCWRMVDTAATTLRIETTQTVRADPGRLQQLVANLVRNTVEHAGPEATLTVGAVEDGFYVADDGPGIPEAERERVFDSGYSTAEDGTGFGLDIVAKVAEAHGWEVAVRESTAGGARFEVTDVETVTGAESG